MSRRPDRNKKRKKAPSASDRRYAARQQALRKMPMRHEGLGRANAASKICRRQAMVILIDLTRRLPDSLLYITQRSSKLRYGFETLFAHELFDSLSRPLRNFFPRVFPLVELNNDGLLISWSGMRSVVTDHGRAFMPCTAESMLPVMYRGVSLQPRFTKHAIARILQRCHRDPSGWYAHDRTFMRLHLQTGALVPWEKKGHLKGFALWDATPGDSRLDFVIQPSEIDESLPFVAPNLPPDFKLWRLIGYLPCEIYGATAVAKTLLYPGMRGTPEQKCGLEDSLTQLSAAEIAQLPTEQQIDLLKRLHAATPQFRQFTPEEATASGNILMAETRTEKRNRFVQRRFAAMLSQMEQSMILKRTA